MVAGVAVLVFVLVRYDERAIHWLLSPLRRVRRDGFAERVEHAAINATRGLVAIRDPRVAVRRMALTVASWVVLSFSYWILMQAFSLDLPFVAALLVTVTINMGLVLPSSPAALGVFEAATVIALNAFDVPQAEALSYALVLHLLNLVPFLVAGAVLLGPRTALRRRQAVSRVRHDRVMADDATTQPPPTSIAEAVGGPLGMAESALPAVAFVVTYTASGSNTNTSAGVAVGLALALTIARLVRRESPRHALSGLFGVALAAFVAAKSGKAENFFLPGLLLNAAYASAFLISAAVRWPLVGARRDEARRRGQLLAQRPLRMRAFRRATLLWAGMFSARLLVQLPLYLAGAVVALGVARTAMGLPVFALCLWLSWLLVRGVRTPRRPPRRESELA